jgi:hypothetical protein
MMGAIMLQIPYELSVGSGDAAMPQSTEIVITANGAASQAFSIAVLTDTLHVLSVCDAFPSKPSGSQIVVNPGCNSVVAHAGWQACDCRFPGETWRNRSHLHLWLGKKTPSVKSGEATPMPALTLPFSEWFSRMVAIQYGSRPDAGPRVPYLALMAGMKLPSTFALFRPAARYPLSLATLP